MYLTLDYSIIVKMATGNKKLKKCGNYTYMKSDIKNVNFEDFTNPWTFAALFMSKDMKLVKWLMERNIFASSMKCVCCGLNCKLGKRAKKIDGSTWRCEGNKNHETSVRRYSFLVKSHLRIQDLFQFTRCFLQDMSLKKACSNAGITYRSAGVDWASFHREICKEYVYTTMTNIVFEGDVEIDESLFGRRCKYHRGNARVGMKVWIFGIISRATNSLILYPVDRRDEETLLPLIKKHVAPGARIFSDSWPAYRNLNDKGFQHLLFVTNLILKPSIKT